MKSSEWAACPWARDATLATMEGPIVRLMHGTLASAALGGLVSECSASATTQASRPPVSEPESVDSPPASEPPLPPHVRDTDALHAPFETPSVPPSSERTVKILATASTTGPDFQGTCGVHQAFTDKGIANHYPVWAEFWTHRDTNEPRPLALHVEGLRPKPKAQPAPTLSDAAIRIRTSRRVTGAEYPFESDISQASLAVARQGPGARPNWRRETETSTTSSWS